MGVWKRTDLPVSSTSLTSGLFLRSFEIKAPAIAGRSLFFFSDTHIHGGYTRNFFGGKLRGWDQVDMLRSMLISVLEKLNPDYLVFGGDLASGACMLKSSFEMLKDLPGGKYGRIAVYGNWDKRRRLWLPFRIYEEGFCKAGFHLLVNEGFVSDGIYFYGLDDFKLGLPEIYAEEGAKQKDLFKCLISHNPDAAEFFAPGISDFNLLLCGHTHGGQVRLPLLGAVKTSSRYWKRFEYGARKNGKTLMYVSSGIGTTLFHLRINCPPEVVLIRFV